MNNKEFIEKVSLKTNFDTADVKDLSASLIATIVQEVVNGNTITVQGFGNFEPREKAKRKIYNPTTKTFNVIPAKKTIGFKMSATLKDRLNMD